MVANFAQNGAAAGFVKIINDTLVLSLPFITNRSHPSGFCGPTNAKILYSANSIQISYLQSFNHNWQLTGPIEFKPELSEVIREPTYLSCFSFSCPHSKIMLMRRQYCRLFPCSFWATTSPPSRATMWTVPVILPSPSPSNRKYLNCYSL